MTVVKGAAVKLATDCNDANGFIFPGTSEFVDDGVDQNCDNLEACFVDFDSDGYRNQTPH